MTNSIYNGIYNTNKSINSNTLAKNRELFDKFSKLDRNEKERVISNKTQHQNKT